MKARTLLRPVLPAVLPAIVACLAVASGAAAAPNEVTAAGGPADSAAAAATPPFEPGQVIVRFDGHAPNTIELPSGVGVREAARTLDRNPDITYAVPNYIARASAFTPNDRGMANVPGGWKQMQWNFLPPACGSSCALGDSGAGAINALGAWRHLRHAGVPGAKGVKIAVIDTGVAFANRLPKYRRSPDFTAHQFVPCDRDPVQPCDLVGDDRYPFDLYGHGTHVAGTIAEQTDNRTALTGLAYNARIIPVRALNRNGFGNAAHIAQGIRYATDHGARVINMSFEFAPCMTAAGIPGVIDALAYAHSRRVVLVAASGNNSDSCAPGAPVQGGKDEVKYPAAYPPVLAVGGVTIRGCRAGYSDYGTPFAESDGAQHGGLDVVAPGGGGDAGALPGPCYQGNKPKPPIFQLTLKSPEQGDYVDFGYPNKFEGTSMAAAHVSGAAAMVIARMRAAGKHAGPTKVAARLESTARQLLPSDPQNEYGAGIVDAAAATRP